MPTVPTQRPSGSHHERQQQLNLMLQDAIRRGNEDDRRLVLAWKDDEYVSRAHLRAEDREIKRLRRWLREAA
jgi:hypothetical protein